MNMTYLPWQSSSSGHNTPVQDPSSDHPSHAGLRAQHLLALQHIGCTSPWDLPSAATHCQHCSFPPQMQTEVMCAFLISYYNKSLLPPRTFYLCF